MAKLGREYQLAEEVGGFHGQVGLGGLAGTALRRLLIGASHFHLAENSLALHLLFQSTQGLINIVIAYDDLQVKYSPILVI